MPLSHHNYIFFLPKKKREKEKKKKEIYMFKMNEVHSLPVLLKKTFFFFLVANLVLKKTCS